MLPPGAEYHADRKELERLMLLRSGALAAGVLAVAPSDMPSAGPPAAVEPLEPQRPLVAPRGPGTLVSTRGLCLLLTLWTLGTMDRTGSPRRGSAKLLFQGRLGATSTIPKASPWRSARSLERRLALCWSWCTAVMKVLVMSSSSCGIKSRQRLASDGQCTHLPGFASRPKCCAATSALHVAGLV